MFDSVIVGKNAKSAESSQELAPVSKVVINVSESTSYISGDDTGRVLEFTNPFGTQAMADDILARLRGVRYQPYKAESAEIDPAAEIGDAVTVNGIYGGLYSRKLNFGRLMKADISAPQDEEIDHEYKFESPERREFSRQIGEVRASLTITNQNISAKVDRQSPTGQTSFSWLMNDTSHTWYANGQEVMRVSASGLSVTGEIKATSGKIGGFNISASAIWNNISSFGGSQSSGVYIGTNGIQLGQRFKVDSSGNVSASNMTLSGTLKIGSTTITADNLRLGAERANSGYSSWNGTTSTVNSSGSYWSGGASYGYDYSNATSSTSGRYPSYFRAESVYTSNMLYANGGFSLGGEPVSKTTISIRDYSGITRTFKVLTYGY